MSFVGASNYTPASSGYKIEFLFNSLVGMSVISVTLTYVMQVYTAVRSRNTVGLGLQTQSRSTGDAAELVARWGPRGHFDGGYSNVSAMAADLAAVEEAHHFYPVVFYFRFEEVYYAAPRILLMAFDAAALIRTALDSGELGWLQESAALYELEQSATLLLRILTRRFPVHSQEHASTPQSRERAQRRYEHALLRLRQAGIPTRPDPDVGAYEYAESRANWEPGVEALARALRFRIEEVDGAGYGGLAHTG